MQPTIQTVPDAAAEELLRPAGSQSPATGKPDEAANAPNDEAFEKALRDGTIPTFDDPPSDTAADPPPPLDIAAERVAWEGLLAMINQHKDAGTVVVAVSVDEFIKDLQ